MTFCAEKKQLIRAISEECFCLVPSNLVGGLNKQDPCQFSDQLGKSQGVSELSTNILSDLEKEPIVLKFGGWGGHDSYMTCKIFDIKVLKLKVTVTCLINQYPNL